MTAGALAMRRSPIAAILWALWRLTAVPFAVCTIVGISVWTLLRFVGVGSSGAAVVHALAAGDSATVFSLIAALTLAGWSSCRVGHELERVFVLPVGTATLVAASAIYLASASVALFVVLTSAAAWLTGLEASLLSLSSLAAATFVLALVMIAVFLRVPLAWRASERVSVEGAAAGAAFFLALFLVNAAGWIGRELGLPGLEQSQGWSAAFRLSAGGVTLLTVLGVVAVSLAHTATAHARHADERSADRHSRSGVRLPTRVAGENAGGIERLRSWLAEHIQTAASAEIARSFVFRFGPLAYLAGFGAMFFLVQRFTNDHHDPITPLFWPLWLLISAGTGTLRTSAKAVTRGIGSFDATRPVSTARLAVWRLGASTLLAVASTALLLVFWVLLGPLLYDEFFGALQLRFEWALPGPMPARLHAIGLVLVNAWTLLALFAALGGFFACGPL